MKRVICIALIFILTMLTLGCGKQSSDGEEPANFYYRNYSVSFFEEDSVIAPEVRDISRFSGNTLSIINAYLEGPLSEKLSSPFPNGLQAVSIDRTGDTLSITFTEQLASLSGLDLSIACACICSTVTELMGNCVIEIKTPVPFLDGAQVITVTQDQLSLLG